MGANLINTYQSKVKQGSFKRLIAEQYCYMFLIICKAVLKSLDWVRVRVHTRSNF